MDNLGESGERRYLGASAVSGDMQLVDPTSVAAVPQAFIDAGDFPWVDLQPVLRRVLRQLLAGHVLELSSGDPRTFESLPGWCAEESLELIHHQPGDGFISFWIGKR